MWFQDLPCCKRRLYEEGSLDPTLSEHSRNKTKSEIFGISTCVHVMSIIYRGADIQHVVDTRRYTSHILITRVSDDVQRKRSTNIVALSQNLPCYQRRLCEEGSLNPTLSEHSRNKTNSKMFEISTSMHVLRCNMQCVTCNVWHAMCYNMLCVTCYV